MRKLVAGCRLVAPILALIAANVSAHGEVNQPGTLSPITVGSKLRLLAPTVVSDRIQGIVLQTDERYLVVRGNDDAPLRVPVVGRAASDEREPVLGRCAPMGPSVALGRRRNGVGRRRPGGEGIAAPARSDRQVFAATRTTGPGGGALGWHHSCHPPYRPALSTLSRNVWLRALPTPPDARQGP